MDISRLTDCKILYNESLSRHSYWRIGGLARYLALPKNTEMLAEVIEISRQLEIPIMIIGTGSNLLFHDDGFDGLVIKLSDNFSEVTVSNNEVIAESGVFVPKLARLTQNHGLSGLEHCIGIPGTLGGLVSMNGGSMRKSISDNIDSITVLDDENRLVELLARECDFGYRNSRFLRSNEIILKVKMKFTLGDRDRIRDEMLEILKSRNARFPRKDPSCGSVFKSDPYVYKTYGAPGYLVEQCGLKGKRIGGAEISPRHANFIINSHNASHKDVLDLVQLMRNKVYERFGIEMEGEARFVDLQGNFIPIHEAEL